MPAMAHAKLERLPEGSPRRFDQGEAVDDGALLGGAIVVIGFQARVAGRAELLGGDGMQAPDLAASGRKGPARHVGRTAGAFDRDQDLAQGMARDGFAALGDGGIQGAAIVVDPGGRKSDMAIEVTQHPFGPGLGRIDGDEADVFGTDLLDTRMDEAPWLLEDVRKPGPGSRAPTSGDHADYLQKEK
jgi:hypothetical protein